MGRTLLEQYSDYLDGNGIHPCHHPYVDFWSTDDVKLDGNFSVQDLEKLIEIMTVASQLKGVKDDNA